MQPSYEDLPFHRSDRSGPAAYLAGIDAVRWPVRPFAAIGRRLDAVHRYHKVASELDHLLDLPEPIFRDIGQGRDEVVRIRKRLRLRDFLDDTGSGGRPGGPV